MGDMNQLKVFTVEEANQLLPKLSELIRELQELRQSIFAKEVEIDALELVMDKGEQGTSPVLDSEVAAYQQAIARFYAVVDEIHRTGSFLKDISTGLVDFYSHHQDCIVYLCWKLGEAEIKHWHEVGSGYAARQPLTLS